MKLESGKFCPLIKKDCIGLQCAWFKQVRGTNPQSGADVDEWDCAIALMPMLVISTAQEVRQGAKATEGLRNEVVARAGILQVLTSPPETGLIVEAGNCSLPRIGGEG